MIKIKLHGILGEEFGDIPLLDITSTSHIIDAIGINKKGFKKRLFDLSREGFQYVILVNGKTVEKIEDLLSPDEEITRVDFVPLISGSIAFLFIAAFFIAVAVVSTIIALATAPDPPKPPELGASSSALSKSFKFQNIANRAQQGTTVPLGYGEYLLGSSVIQATSKSFSLTTSVQTAYNAYNNGNKGAGSEQAERYTKE